MRQQSDVGFYLWANTHRTRSAAVDLVETAMVARSMGRSSIQG